jgi:uncharacterized protein
MVINGDFLLKVAVFLDGSPGHEKQTLGIVRALQHLHPLEVTEIKIDHASPWQDVSVWLRYFLGMDFPSTAAQKPYDILIGTGAHTHIPMLSCKRHSGAFSIVCMAPSWVLRSGFDLCCIPQHDGVETGENVFLTVGPPNYSEAKTGHDRNKALILLGGVDTKSHNWSSEDIGSYVRDLVSKGHEKEWTISSSPRTPEETVSLVERISEQFDNITFFRYENTPTGWVEKQYCLNGRVWVTADSMSMVYEALSAGCHVGIIPVIWKNQQNKFKRSETYLLEQGLVVSFSDWQAGIARWRLRAPLNEAGRCAEEIMRRWLKKN